MNPFYRRSLYLLLLPILFIACRNDEYVFYPEEVPVSPADSASHIAGFYLLNEGNMGMNAASLDYYDYETGIFSRDVYAAANPDVPMDLGDVGNDIAIYGSKLYVLVNCSNKLEVLDALTCRRIAKIDIPNCRSIAFDGPYAYITSYAGPVEIGPEHAQKGFVAKIDTASLAEVGRCIVGYQPDGLAISKGHIYVANSGGYMVPNYENTLSVIDLATFAVDDTVQIAINLNHVVADPQGNLWVSSRGDYYGTPSQLFCYDPYQHKVIHQLPVIANAMWLHKGQLYTLGAGWNYETGDTQDQYAIIDTRSGAIVTTDFIADASVRARIKRPYGIAVNPETSQILVTDGGDYVSPGRLYAFDPQGNLQWDVRAGDIPAHIAFLKKF